MPREYNISSESIYSSSDNERELGEGSDEEVLLIDHSQCSSSDEEEKKKNCDDNFEPWEEYGEETYLEDLIPPFKRRYKSRGLLSGLNEPIDFFSISIYFKLLQKTIRWSSTSQSIIQPQMSTISKHALLVMIVN